MASPDTTPLPLPVEPEILDATPPARGRVVRALDFEHDAVPVVLPTPPLILEEMEAGDFDKEEEEEDEEGKRELKKSRTEHEPEGEQKGE